MLVTKKTMYKELIKVMNVITAYIMFLEKFHNKYIDAKLSLEFEIEELQTKVESLEEKIKLLKTKKQTNKTN